MAVELNRNYIFTESGSIGIRSSNQSASATFVVAPANNTFYLYQGAEYMANTGLNTIRTTNGYSAFGPQDGILYFFSASGGTVGNQAGWTEKFRVNTSGEFNVGTGSTGSAKIYSYATSGTYAVRAESTSGVGVLGWSRASGASANYGVIAESDYYYGILGRSYSASYGGILGYNHLTTVYGIVGYGSYSLYTNASIYVNGTTYSSDARLKENVVPITGALAKLAQLNPVSFDWKANSNRGKIAGRKVVPDYGVIAQEVEPILPEVVFEAKTPPRTREDTSETTIEEEIGTHKGVDYSRFIPFLIAAIKEQQTTITQLTERISVLESK